MELGGNKYQLYSLCIGLLWQMKKVVQKIKMLEILNRSGSTYGQRMFQGGQVALGLFL